MYWILKIQLHLTDISTGPLSGELFFFTTGKFLYLIIAQSVERLTYTVHSDLKITEK